MTKQQQDKQDNPKLENFNSNVNGIPFVDINYDLYKPTQYGGLVYKDIDGEAVQCERLIKAGQHFILEGEKGLGKTLMVNDLCFSMDMRLVAYNCSSATSESELLGQTIITKDGTFAFQLGVLPIGIMCANKFGKAVIYLDECNTPNPDVQKILNSITDDRRMCIANNHVFKVNEGCQLVVIGTMNPLSYSGVNSLNEDLISRFMGKVIKTPQRDVLKSIIDWKKVPDENIESLLTLAEDIRNLRNTGTVDYSLSTRDMQQFATLYSLTVADTTPENALRTALEMTVSFKMPTEEQRASVNGAIKDVFGVILK